MHALFRSALVSAAVVASCAATAAPVSLGSVQHLYGSTSGRVAPTIFSEFHPGGNCDTLNASSITVRATSASTCNRFGDIFDFSGIDYSSIASFAVTLEFTGARGALESWSVRGAGNYVQSANSFGTLQNNGPQGFTYLPTNGNFGTILSTEKFVLSFAQSGFAGSSSNFALTSATVQLFGEAAVAEVPEPASLALIGLSLAALGLARRRKQG